MYREENEQVVLTLTVADYEQLLMALGIAAGACRVGELDWHLGLVNRINEGNPRWTPYKLRGE